MDLFYRLVFDLLYYVFYLLQALLSVFQLFVGYSVLHYHELLPVLQGGAVPASALFLVPFSQKCLENIDELTFHKKVPHCFDDVVMATSGQQHVVNSFLEEGVDNAGDKQAQDIEVSDHLEDGVLRQVNADGPDDRVLSDFAEVDADGGQVEQKPNSKDHEQFSLH